MIIRVVDLGPTQVGTNNFLSATLPRNLIIERIGFYIAPNSTFANPFPNTTTVNIYSRATSERYVTDCSLKVTSFISGTPFRSIFGGSPDMVNDFTDVRIKFNPKDFSASAQSGGLSTVGKVVIVEVETTVVIPEGQSFMIVEARVPNSNDKEELCVRYFSPNGVAPNDDNTVNIQQSTGYLYGIAGVTSSLSPYAVIAHSEIILCTRQAGTYGGVSILGAYNYDGSFEGLPSMNSLNYPAIGFIQARDFVSFTQSDVAILTVTGR